MLKRRIQRFHDRFISLKGEPRSIAMGMAVGVFVGVTPTIPFHTALIILFGLIWKHNLTSAYLGSWLKISRARDIFSNHQQVIMRRSAERALADKENPTWLL